MSSWSALTAVLPGRRRARGLPSTARTPWNTAAGMCRRTFQRVAAGVIAAVWLPTLVQAPSGRAAWDLRTTGRQVVVQGHQAHPGRLPSSFHMASVEDTAEECRETGAVSFSSTNLALVSNRDSYCRAESQSDQSTCASVEYVIILFAALLPSHIP